MGKAPMSENSNPYFRARKAAAIYNERLYSREGASELLGISVSTLADYELGNTKVVPVDKVVLMADLYNAPELITGYCVNECPVHGFMPMATKEGGIQGVALRLLKNLNDDVLDQIRKDAVDIMEDGQITDEEIPVLKEIMERLERVAEAISELKLAGEKIIKGGCGTR